MLTKLSFRNMQNVLESLKNGKKEKIKRKKNFQIKYYQDLFNTIRKSGLYPLRGTKIENDNLFL